VTAGPGAPAGDLKTVLAWMKANPGKANYATSGAGTVPHFAGLLHLAGGGRAADARGLPRRRAGRAGPDRRPDPADGRHRVRDHRAPRAGKVRILAVTGEQRTKALPDVPTLKERAST
jgi:tripartite-type tricarboxylate transporter receptor subunit TctC